MTAIKKRTAGTGATRVVEAIQRIANEQGVSTLSFTDYQRLREKGDPAPVTATRVFGTWAEALRAAGMDVDELAPRTRSQVERPRPSGTVDGQQMEETIIATIKRIAGELGVEQLSTNQYVKHIKDGEPAVITVIRRFNGWKSACEAAGLTPNPNSKAGEVSVSNSEALDGVRRAAKAFAADTGREPAKLTQAYYAAWRREHNGLGLPNLTKRFGKWNTVKDHAGLK